MRVALGQIAGGPDKEANLRRIGDHVARAAAAGARLVLFPECAMVHHSDPETPYLPDAEPLDGPFGTGLRELAARHGLAVACGMFEPADGGRVYNTVLAVDRDGTRLAAYRKIHLYDAFAYQESRHVAPGAGDVAAFTLDGVRFGVMTCYDVRFPELGRLLVDSGAEAVLLPAAWVRGPLKEAHWETLVRARAIENTVYVLACGLTARQSCGLSMVVDPMGVPVAQTGEGEALVVADVEPQTVAAARAVNPSLRNRRVRIGGVEAPIPV
jgi:deaminated glutathione amidase